MKGGSCLFALLAGSCSLAPPDLPPRERIDLAPAPGQAFDAATTDTTVALDPATIGPMYRELLAIDLSATVQVAMAQNLDVMQARERVEALRAQLFSATGWIFPTLSPTIGWEHVDGTVRATAGNLVDVGFTTLQPYVLAQWLLNPGKVYYEVLAAQKRVVASQHFERAAQMLCVHRAANGYYDLVLAQTQVAAARQTVAEARELLRITQVRRGAGNALPGDELRTKAELAEREQGLLLALRAFANASVSLAETLDLDPTMTLVPSATEVSPHTLVRSEIEIDELLAIAIGQRDDLEAVRTLIAASSDDASAAWWTALGPQASAGYRYGGISGDVDDPATAGANRSGMHQQRRITAGAGFSLSLASLGQADAASTAERQALLDGAQKLAAVRADVVRADQERRTQNDLMVHAREQLAAADEAVRLAKATFDAGAMTLLDVLQDESRLARARLRHAETVVRYNQAQIDLLAAVGVLDDGVFTTESGR